jgi:putative membrane protein
MVGLVLRMLLVAFGLWVASKIVPGIYFDGWKALLLAALVLGAVNAIIRPILIFLTLPITLLTLGLFLFIINAFLFYAVAKFVPGFTVDTFLHALLGSIVVGITGWIGGGFINHEGRVKTIYVERQG